jgi:hypothetical protein
MVALFADNKTWGEMQHSILFFLAVADGKGAIVVYNI